MTPGPGLRKWTEYLSPGPGGMPLALRLSDWLGFARARTARHAVIPLHAPPPGLPALRCRRCRGRISSRRASAVAEKANAGPGGPRNWLTIIAAYAVRCSDLVRCLQVIVFARRRIVVPAATCLLLTLSLFLTSTRLGPTVLCVVAGRTGLSRLLSSPREALTLLAHRTACFVRPNVRAKRAATAWRAGQQAQNGPQAQRLMASVTCRWRSA